MGAPGLLLLLLVLLAALGGCGPRGASAVIEERGVECSGFECKVKDVPIWKVVIGHTSHATVGLPRIVWSESGSLARTSEGHF
ncbi:Protein of unknown function [Gryllus bimaculatus]|nr:Protein of unknown function [Gryllus bimaculatus]